MSSRGHRVTHHDERLPIDPDLAPDDPGEPGPAHRPVLPHIHRSRRLDVLGAIAAGGFVGAWARYELGLTWPASPGHMPWATLTVNLSGALLLGIILTVLLERVGPTRRLRPFLCTGVLGSWTTMSTFAVEADLLVRDGHPGTALVYVALTVVLGLAAGWFGLAVGRRLDVGSARWSSPSS